MSQWWSRLIGRLRTELGLNADMQALSRDLAQLVASQSRTQQRELDETRLLLGQVLARQLPDRAVELASAEFKVFSQFGEDGIIQYLIRYLDIEPQRFVEIGVENYREANTRFLLQHNNWRGLIIDGDAQQLAMLEHDPIRWRHDLTVAHSFVTRENINQLLTSYDVQGEIGLLSIDVDGIDYWLWEALTVAQPRLVVMEYNSVFGANAAVTVPYSAEFNRTDQHYSNLYFGASLAALTQLAERKEYALVGCNSAGNNAFFVQHDYLRDLPKLTPQQAFVDAKFRESRNVQGKLTYLSGDARREKIAHLSVYDIEKNAIVRLSEIFH